MPEKQDILSTARRARDQSRGATGRGSQLVDDLAALADAVIHMDADTHHVAAMKFPTELHESVHLTTNLDLTLERITAAAKSPEPSCLELLNWHVLTISILSTPIISNRPLAYREDG